MPDRSSLSPASEPTGRSAQERRRAATSALLALLASRDGIDPEVMTARGELARATAACGEADEAYYQVDELIKDAERHFAEGHPVRAEAHAVLADVRAALETPDA